MLTLLAPDLAFRASAKGTIATWSTVSSSSSSSSESSSSRIFSSPSTLNDLDKISDPMW